jgi:hypothetical protein
MSEHYSGHSPELGALILLSAALVVALVLVAVAVWVVLS